MNPVIPCPVCDSASRSYFATKDAVVRRCDDCTHVFTDPASITNRESYSPDYFEERHRNWFAHPNISLFRFIAGVIPDSCRSIIDVGCGDGAFLRFISQHRPDLECVGIDRVPNAPSGNIKFIQSDFMDYRFGRTFDVIVSLAVIEHVDQVQPFVRRLTELGHPGTLVITMTLNSTSWLYQCARWARFIHVDLPSDRLYDPHHLHHFTVRSLAHVLARRGINILRSHHHNIPIRSVDAPSNPLVRWPVLFAVGWLFLCGRMSGDRCFLQTVVGEIA